MKFDEIYSASLVADALEIASDATDYLSGPPISPGRKKLTRHGIAGRYVENHCARRALFCGFVELVTRPVRPVTSVGTVSVAGPHVHVNYSRLLHTKTHVKYLFSSP